MNTNNLRRLNWLWKNRHIHDGENLLQEQITIIRETVEQVDERVSAGSIGAHIHVTRLTSQTIPVGGEAIAWTAYNPLIPRQHFAAISFPATEIIIQEPGYYNIAVSPLDGDSKWDSYTGGGTFQIVHIRDDVEIVLAEVSATNGQEFFGIAQAIPCLPGDKVRVFLDHNDSSPHDLASASLGIYLVDGTSDSSAIAAATAGVVDTVDSKAFGVTDHDIAMTTAQREGDLLMMVLVGSGGQWTVYPSGWTVLVSNFEYGLTGGWISILYKESDGSETATVATTSGTANSYHAVWVVRSERDYSAVFPEAGTPIKVMDTATINPNPVAPSTPGNYVVFPIIGRNGGPRDAPPPTGYSLVQSNAVGEGSPSNTHPGGNIYQRTVVITTNEDPGSLTFTTTWVAERIAAITVAVPI